MIARKGIRVVGILTEYDEHGYKMLVENLL